MRDLRLGAKMVGTWLLGALLAGCLSNPTPHPGKTDVRSETQDPTSGEVPGDMNATTEDGGLDAFGDCFGRDTQVDGDDADVGCGADDVGPVDAMPDGEGN